MGIPEYFGDAQEPPDVQSGKFGAGCKAGKTEWYHSSRENQKTKVEVVTGRRKNQDLDHQDQCGHRAYCGPHEFALLGTIRK